jgi:DNA gyrase subunit B
MSNLYNEKSIESLSPLEFTRLRPGVYAGNTTYSTQLLVEIISNAVDEYRLGHGNKINVTLQNDVVIVEDFGQGFIPNSFREDGKTILEAAFSVLNTSGKYRDDGTYEGTSLGSFGIGSKITTYLSHWLEVITYRDNMYEHLWFKEGVFDKREVGVWKNGTTGTLVQWQPSEEFFKNTTVEIEKVKSLFKTITCLCPGLTINLDDNGKKTVFYSEHGLNDLVDEYVGDKEILKNRFDMRFSEGKYKMDLVMTYTSNYSLTIVPYVNTGLTETGPHITQLKTTLTREFNKFFKEKKWLKEKDENLTGDDIQEGMYIVFNMTAPSVQYDAQVKSRVTAIETKAFMSSFAEELQIWFAANEKELKAIAEKAINARKARNAAKKAREAIRGKAEKKTVLKLPSKLTDCWSKDRKKCEIFIVEGDSAGGNMKTGKDNEFQAVLPVRGKILNIQKAAVDKIMANAEIRDMIKAFGLDLNVKTGKVLFDESKLRYGKIIISADADVDGSHIQSLFYTFVWNFCPELIEKGYVYATVPPLFKVTEGKDTYIYLKDEAALQKYVESHKGKKYIVARHKGLGEMDVEELEESLLNAETRVLKQITVDDVEKTNILFDQLMGQSAVPRKKYIEEHSHEAEVEY